MREWLGRIVGALAVLFILLTVGWFWVDQITEVKIVRYTSNDKLDTVKPGWPGTPVDEDENFVNYEHPFVPRLTDLVRWRLSGNPFKDDKKNDTRRIEVGDPSVFLASNDDGILWLGHASFFIRLDGVNFLLDPIFGEPPFLKRYVDVPTPLPMIRHVDYVLLSHDHRDHTDETTLKQIVEKFPEAIFIGGLEMHDILTDWKTPTNQVGTGGWFQKFDLPDGVPQVIFVPVRHWARRGLFDRNKRLWGGYVIKGHSTSIYFGGDSGYGRHYKDVAEVFPTIDYFLIGIGAYEPRWFMEPNHNSPSDALNAFADLGAKTFIPMHFGTFDLSDEPPSAPLRELMKGAAENGLTDRIKVLNINESLELTGEQENDK